jgi:hypothetical protein
VNRYGTVTDLRISDCGKTVLIGSEGTGAIKGILRTIAVDVEKIETKTFQDIEPKISYGRISYNIGVDSWYANNLPSDTPVTIIE